MLLWCPPDLLVKHLPLLQTQLGQNVDVAQVQQRLSYYYGSYLERAMAEYVNGNTSRLPEIAGVLADIGGALTDRRPEALAHYQEKLGHLSTYVRVFPRANPVERFFVRRRFVVGNMRSRLNPNQLTTLISITPRKNLIDRIIQQLHESGTVVVSIVNYGRFHPDPNWNASATVGHALLIENYRIEKGQVYFLIKDSNPFSKKASGYYEVSAQKLTDHLRAYAYTRP